MNGSKLIIEMMERNYVEDQICIKQRRHMADTYPKIKTFYGFWFKLTKGSRSVNSMDWARESRSWPSRSVLLLVPLLDEAVLPTPLSLFKAFNLSDMSMTKLWCWKDFTRSTRQARREKWFKICKKKKRVYKSIFLTCWNSSPFIPFPQLLDCVAKHVHVVGTRPCSRIAPPFTISGLHLRPYPVFHNQLFHFLNWWILWYFCFIWQFVFLCHWFGINNVWIKGRCMIQGASVKYWSNPRIRKWR